jgi:hypothetical protein
MEWILWLLLGLFGGFTLPFGDTYSDEAVATVEPPPPAPSASASAETSPAPGTAPSGSGTTPWPAHQQWIDREPLADCGSIPSGGHDAGPWRENPAVDCLRQAAAHGLTGELRVVFTGEGRLLEQWHRVTADSLLEVYSRHTLGWRWEQCPLPREVTDGCADAEWTLTTP